MKKYIRLLSCILLGCLIIPMFSGFVSSDASTEIVSIEDGEVFILPDIVEPDEAVENGYVGRANAEENDLYSFVFQNSDGSNTMRTYSHPVKYVDANGAIRDISLDIKEKGDGSYITADHEIVTTFEKKLSDGVALEYNDIEVKLVPIASKASVATAKPSSDKRSVIYELDRRTSYVYKLTYTGFKEDIVVSEYTGQTEYSFTLYTNGLTLCEQYGSYYLADANGAVKATIGDIIVFTADEQNNTMGTMTYETVRANQEYELIIHLDAEYLRDADTTYPIRIDPTVEVNYENDGAGVIEDVTINQNVTFSGTSGSLSVGRHPAGSLSRTLMRFPNLEMPVPFAPMIISANVEIRDLMCQSNENVAVYCYAYSETAPSWSEATTTTWDSVGTDYIGALQDNHAISKGYGNVAANRYAFNITDIAKDWADGVASPDKGIVFKAAPDFESQTGEDIQYFCKTFASYNRSSNKPSLTIKYVTEFICTLESSANSGKSHIMTSGSLAMCRNTHLSLKPYYGFLLWCIEYLPRYKCFSITSLDDGDESGVQPYILCNSDSSTWLINAEATAGYRQYKPIRKIKDLEYYFQNVRHKNYITFPEISYDQEAALTVSTEQNSFSSIIVREVRTHTFNNFMSGAYKSGIYDGKVHVKVLLDSSIADSSLFADNDFSAALLWNGISENVMIYGPNDAVPEGITPFYVTFKTYEPTDPERANTKGEAIPDIDYIAYDALTIEEKVQLSALDWNKVTIYLNNRSEKNPFTEGSSNDAELKANINKTICHEMGHALKLLHPDSKNDGGWRHTFLSNREDYPSNNPVVYSVMNSGNPVGPKELARVAAVPQCHDVINLISKWEYHLNCDH